MLGVGTATLLLHLADEREDLTTELFDFLIVMQESGKDDIDTEGFQQTDALGDLLLGADELGLEAVVVLDEILEFRVGPHAALVARGRAGVLDLLAETFDGFLVGFALDLLQHADGFLFGLAADDEGVEREADLSLAAVLGGALFDVGDLGLEALEGVAVHEVVIRYGTCVVLGIVAVAALEDLGVRTAGPAEGLGFERIIVELVEVALVGELLVGPDALQTFDEFTTSAVALGVFEPPLSDASELC